MTQAEVTLPATVNSVPTARHFIESILSGWGLKELGWPATLIVSELAANAALHARGDSFSIRIQTEVDGVRIEVSDTSFRLPQQRSYSDDATTGRGLRLVTDLASEWGVAPTDCGKTIWALLRTGDAGRASEDERDVDALLSAYDKDDEVIALPDATRPQARLALAA